MIGIIAGAVTGALLGANGYAWDDQFFWLVLIPVCAVAALVDVTLRSNVV